jgi:DNA-binding NtrC family response regulator
MVRVLLVDDEEDICLLLKENLEAAGMIKVSYVLCGEDAMKVSGEEDFKLAIIDLKLSTKLTGVDTIRAIRQMSPQTAIAAMTGYIDDDLKKETQRLGVEAYLEKPGDISDSEKLMDKIKRLL